MGRRWALVLVLCALALLPTSPAKAATTEVPASIDPSGSSDVTDALNKVIADAAPGTTIKLRAGATYLVEGTLLLASKRDLTIDGNGATLVAKTDGSGRQPGPGQAHKWPRTRSHVSVRNSTGIVLDRLTIDGPHSGGGTGDGAYVAALEAQHGVEVLASDTVRVTGLTAKEVYGDFVYIGGASKHIVVRGANVHHNGRQGMSVTSGEDILLEDNAIDQVRRTMFDIETNTVNDVVRNVRISRNRIGFSRLNFLSNVGAGGVVEDIAVEGNTVKGDVLAITAVVPTGGRRRVGFRLVGNVSDTNGASPGAIIRFQGFDDLLVADNVQHMLPSRKMPGMQVREVCRLTVARNDFSGSSTEVDGQDSCPSTPSTAPGTSVATTKRLPRPVGPVASTTPRTIPQLGVETEPPPPQPADVSESLTTTPEPAEPELASLSPSDLVAPPANVTLGHDDGLGIALPLVAVSLLLAAAAATAVSAIGAQQRGR